MAGFASEHDGREWSEAEVFVVGSFAAIELDLDFGVEVGFNLNLQCVDRAWL